jgi:hypothetical protein
MKIEKASYEKESELTEFFEQFELEDFIRFQIKRSEGFFTPYKAQGLDFEVYTLRDKSDNLLALATFVFPEYRLPLENKKIKLAFATDLRVLPSRQATLGWHQHFIPVLERIREEKKVHGFLSLLSKHDRRILNTFLRSHPFRRETPKYYLCQNYHLTSIHGFLPFSKVTLPHVQVTKIQPSQWAHLDSFLSKNRSLSCLHLINSAEDLKNKLHPMNLPPSEHIWVASLEDSEDILGVLVTIPSSHLQKYIPLSYQRRADNLRQFLNFSQIFGWSHPLPPPQKTTGLKEELEFHHMGFIRVLHGDIFQKMIQHLWSHFLKEKEFLVYLRDSKDLILTPRQGVLSTNLDYDLFSITLPQENHLPLDPPWGESFFSLDSFYHF